jgi:hypothetical protein
MCVWFAALELWQAICDGCARSPTRLFNQPGCRCPLLPLSDTLYVQIWRHVFFKACLLLLLPLPHVFRLAVLLFAGLVCDGLPSPAWPPNYSAAGHLLQLSNILYV